MRLRSEGMNILDNALQRLWVRRSSLEIRLTAVSSSASSTRWGQNFAEPSDGIVGIGGCATQAKRCVSES